MLYFSASKNGFFNDKKHKIPTDAVEVKDKRHKELIKGQSEGKEIYADSNGVPKLRDKVLSDAALASIRKREGIEFSGIMCSATKEDMYGLSAVRQWVIDGETINFRFSNGNNIELTPENVLDFDSVWVPFRISFF